ncbi:unnamed protein product [Rangifer tarandus platyrhynchus]|uniref:Uncharacterized protein n=1 Tax=Rangifer tarandus platyrhynchus TaxID=3082113 RepID=A0AC59ZZS0_RANTA
MLLENRLDSPFPYVACPDTEGLSSSTMVSGMEQQVLESLPTQIHPPHFGPVCTLKYTSLPKKMGFPGGSGVKNLPAKARDAGLLPGLGRSPGEGIGKYSCL